MTLAFTACATHWTYVPWFDAAAQSHCPSICRRAEVSASHQASVAVAVRVSPQAGAALTVIVSMPAAVPV